MKFKIGDKVFNIETKSFGTIVPMDTNHFPIPKAAHQKLCVYTKDSQDNAMANYYFYESPINCAPINKPENWILVTEPNDVLKGML